MFIKDGRINNQEKENDFINANSQYLQDLSNPSIEGEFSFELLSEDEVLITKLFYFEDDMRNVTSISRVDYWENEEFSNVNQNFQENERFYKHHPITVEMTPTGSNKFDLVIKHCFYMIRENNENIKMPMIDYAPFTIVPQTGLPYVVYLPSANNEFNIESISELRETDTIIIREYHINFK